MAITNQDFQLTLSMTYRSVPCTAVFWYHKFQSHSVNDSQTLLTAFDALVLDNIAALLNTQVSFDNLTAINLVDMNDYSEMTPTHTVGLISSTSPGPTFVAYKFRMVRSTRAGRHGYKRFPGVAEELIAQFASSASGLVATAAPLLCTALAAMISAGGQDFFPGIPQRDLVTLPDGSQEYVLINLNPFTTVVFEGLTTQSSRKV